MRIGSKRREVVGVEVGRGEGVLDDLAGTHEAVMVAVGAYERPGRGSVPYACFRRTVRGAPRARASFSSSAFQTKSIRGISSYTQCSLSSRCSAFGIRVASCTKTSSSLRAMLDPP